MTKLNTRVENENTHEMSHLTNASGGSVTTGDVLIPNGTANQLTTNTEEGALKPIFIVPYDPTGADGDDLLTHASAGDGWFRHGGLAKDVQIDGAIAVNEWLKLSSTAKKLTGTGTTIGSVAPAGTVAMSLESLGAAGQADVLIVAASGGAGIYAEISASDASDTIAIGSSGQANKVQVTTFNTNGNSNDMTPDHTNDHITCDVAGDYVCSVNITAESVPGAGYQVGFSVYKNNGATEFVNVHAHHDFTGGGGDTDSISMSGNITLAVNDTIELWVWNETSTSNVIIDDVTLHLEIAQGGATGPQGPQGSPGDAHDVVNSSGATASIGDVGYLDEAGEYQTTTTAQDLVTWVVVTSGGLDTATITVARRGNVTVNYTGTAPAQDDFLVTSTSAGDAQRQTTMHPAIFAIATAAGSGGTVSALLYTQTTYVPTTDATFLHECLTHTGTGWTAQINSGGFGGLTATNVPFDTVVGNTDAIEPRVSELGKQRLHNLTRGDYRLIDTVDVANSAITTISSTDSWADNDNLTIESQTVTSPGADKYIDIDLSQQSAAPILTRAIAMKMDKFERTTAGASIIIHPFETFASSKNSVLTASAINVVERGLFIIPIIDRVFCWRGTANGAASADDQMSIGGLFIATP
jgi:hypothetical protein